MKEDLARILRCPFCISPLALSGAKGRKTAVTSGLLQCEDCRRRFPIEGGIPRFVPTDGYASNFSFEWSIHRRTQIDTADDDPSARALREYAGLTREDLKGKLTLDAGVGAGRFAEVASRWGARVIGLDLSNSVEVAYENLSDRSNVDLVQADLFAPPFEPETFDVAYSIGVLHHTPDAAAAFGKTAELVRPGGVMAVWVYSGHNRWYRFSDIYRHLTTRMPPRVLYALSHLAVPGYHVGRIPVIGRIFRHLLPLSDHPNWRWRVLDTFDWYSPVYQSKHTFPEVVQWFKSAEFQDMDLFENPPVGVRATKSLGAAKAPPSDLAFLPTSFDSD